MQKISFSIFSFILSLVIAKFSLNFLFKPTKKNKKFFTVVYYTHNEYYRIEFYDYSCKQTNENKTKKNKKLIRQKLINFEVMETITDTYLRVLVKKRN